MSPILQSTILNGASRHRLNKGFLLLQQNCQPVPPEIRQTYLNETNRHLQAQPMLSGFCAEPQAPSTCAIGLVTPFLHVHTPSDRDAFVSLLHAAILVLTDRARQGRLLLVPAGINPFVVDHPQAPALCADFHQIEVYDDGEIERIYNLFRQLLPELLSISSHSAVFGGGMQRDFSMRMRVNPSGFLPRYLSQFTVEHLDRIKNMMRRSYGLADLTQMDVNPMAGDTVKLKQANSPLLTPQPAAIELRFVDSQVSYSFVRAQIVLFQAIAIYGRGLARSGRRLPFLRDENIDENKALTIQHGPGAILVPDPKFSQEREGQNTRKARKKQFTFHDQGKPERATTALLMVIENMLLPSLCEIRCEFREVAPIILGAELRKRGRQCFANYAEYQKYLQHTSSGNFAQVFYEQSYHMLTNPALDPITDYNRRTFQEITTDIEETWNNKLRADIRERLRGKVVNYNHERRSGYIQVGGQPDVFFRAEDVLDDSDLHLSDVVSFIIVEDRRRPRAAQIELVEAAPRSMPPLRQASRRETGSVKWYSAEKRFGYISVPEGGDVFVHQSALRGVKELQPQQKVEFEIIQDAKGPKAANVRVIAEEQS